MAGFKNEVMNAQNVNFGTVPLGAAEVVADGQLLIGSTVAPNIRVATLTAGAGISITNGAGSITVTNTSAGGTWLDTAGGALAANTGYFVTAAAAVTLPLTPAQGTIVEIVDQVGGGVVVTAAGANIIQVQNVASSAGGTSTSTQKGDALRLVFRTADLTWYCAPGAGGNWILA